ncbi:MAG: ROK family protein [Arcanobacterium sp.]|nr:ROK family protein [Arcanobacterium sp.]MDY5589829.1 ROK family protein [Arcanobacterium sp.]
MGKKRSLKSASPALAREHNKALIVKLLYPARRLSRPQIAKLTHLSVPNVTALVKELLEVGILKEYGVRPEVQRNVGKPASQVGIDIDGNRCILLELSGENFVATELDLLGKAVARHVHPRNSSRYSGHENFQGVLALAARSVSEASAHVVGMVVSVPGLVDSEGTVIISDSLGWRNLELGAELMSTVHTPVVVANGVDLLGIGLSTGMQGAELVNAVIVSLDYGVGAAAIVDGRLVAGSHFAAGEIGHVKIEGNTEKCECGRTGCLNLVVGVPKVQQKILHEPQRREEIIGTAAQTLAKFMSPVLSLFDLSTLCVVTRSDLIGESFVNELRRALEIYIRSETTRTDVMLGEQQELHVRGALTAILGRVFPLDAASAQPW